MTEAVLRTIGGRERVDEHSAEGNAVMPPAWMFCRPRGLMPVFMACILVVAVAVVEMVGLSWGGRFGRMLLFQRKQGWETE